MLADLSWRDLVPAIWLPDPSIRRERALARFRLHLVRHRTTLKNRIHATLVTFGHPCPVSDLFGLADRERLDRLEIPDPWRRDVDVSLGLSDDLELQIARLTVELKERGADHRYIPLLVTAPRFGWINAPFADGLRVGLRRVGARPTWRSASSATASGGGSSGRAGRAEWSTSLRAPRARTCRRQGRAPGSTAESRPRRGSKATRSRRRPRPSC